MGLVDNLRKGGELKLSFLFNVFENIASARFPEIGVSQRHMVKMGAADVLLAGSGPALFTLAMDRNEAEELYIRLQQRGFETYLAETLAAIEKVE